MKICDRCGSDQEIKEYRIIGTAFMGCEANMEWLALRKEALLKATRTEDQHPDWYDGPCECRTCMGYGAADSLRKVKGGE